MANPWAKTLRNKLSLIVIALIICLGAPLFQWEAQSATPSQISITGLAIQPTASGPNGQSRMATLSGTYISPSQLDSVELVLATFGPIRTRAELDATLKNPKTSRGSIHADVSTQLTNVQALKITPWTLTFDAAQYFGSSANGVFGLGVAQRNTAIQANIPVPWFTGKVPVQPTRVVFVAQVAGLNAHLADGTSLSLGADATNLNRIRNIVNTKVPINWAVDASVVQWVNDLKSTALGTKADEVQQLIAATMPSANPIIYGHANLKALIKEKPSDVDTVLNASGANSQKFAYYFPPFGEVGNQTLNALKTYGSIVPVLSNQFVYGGKSETSQAHALINDTSILIKDQTASECFERKTRFDMVTCLNATVAMMTSQSPNAPRTVFIATPALWEPSSGDITVLATQLNNQRWSKIVTVKDALTEPATRLYRQIYPKHSASFEKTLLTRSDLLIQKARVLGTAFNDAGFTNSYVDVQLRGYSDLWTPENTAVGFIKANAEKLEAVRNQIEIQSSNRVTIATAKTEIPITIANQTLYPLTVRVALSSKSTSRFSATTSEFVTIQSKQRVTVPIKIELSGTGSVEVVARLRNLDNQYIGISKTMQIASSAYQSIARTLVWGAFGLLVLLAGINSVRVRSRAKSKKAESTTEDSLDETTTT